MDDLSIIIIVVIFLVALAIMVRKMNPMEEDDIEENEEAIEELIRAANQIDRKIVGCLETQPHLHAQKYSEMAETRRLLCRFSYLIEVNTVTAEGHEEWLDVYYLLRARAEDAEIHFRHLMAGLTKQDSHQPVSILD